MGGGYNVQCYSGKIIHCTKRHKRKPRMHQWRLLITEQKRVFFAHFSFIMTFLVLILGCLATCSQAQVLPNNLNCPFNNNIACRPDEKSCPMPNLGLLGCPAPPMCIPAKGKNDTNKFLCFVVWYVFRNWLLYKLTSKQVMCSHPIAGQNMLFHRVFLFLTSL